MKNLCTIGTSILFILLILSACDDNKSNYPKNYVGFGKGIESYTVNRQSAEQDITIKIITAEKSSKDREVTLSSHWKPGTQPAFKLLDTQIIIPAKKKSATARIRIYPKQIKRTQEIRIICTPKDKEIKRSQLTIKLFLK